MSGVDTRADLQVKGSQCIADRPRALHRARGAIERREEAATGVVDLAAAKPVELFAHDRVVLLEQVAPPRISGRGSKLRRSDDVCEQDRAQNPIDLRYGTYPGNELLDLVAAKRMHTGPPSPYPTKVAFFEPAASITASTSSMRSSRVGTLPLGMGSDRPVPRLSNMSTRAKEP